MFSFGIRKFCADKIRKYFPNENEHYVAYDLNWHKHIHTYVYPLNKNEFHVYLSRQHGIRYLMVFIL